ncbi:uncharacterized protein LOC132274459 isoform X2 [Cornus florida]|uniref:uncharacterized protein LOC132274459 isoform X2 n=1 Tax=Cornus florida TaxID=4283 RepID=UPI0028A2878E|nr:uncharacterized protein LOC132274459 isoform X2 [Cornus florida]
MSTWTSSQGDDRIIKYMPLYWALVKGDLEKVEAYLAEDPNAIYAQISTTGETPIHVAVSHGHEELVKELLEITSGPEKPEDMKDGYGNTPLHIAARGANRSIANVIVHQSPSLLAVGNADGQFPITIATIFGNYEMLSILKTHGLGIAMHHNSDGPDPKWEIFTEFKSKNFDLARKIFFSVEPELMIFEDVLYIMAEMTSVFLSANQPAIFRRWIYSCTCMNVLYSSLKKDMDAMDVFLDARSPLSNSKRFIKGHRWQVADDAPP